ncbi:hypothetical protein [Limnovirga soli]|uniref:Uncharacterized protein n=1 Tax=Limnovirga soli TaxID=2656915 RepID=A0A8J8FDV3_9BACT|nr:hypothetical protein [Limnovirga soli]NNV56261.1 hypothetical protein [Limnovirga soli]
MKKLLFAVLLISSCAPAQQNKTRKGKNPNKTAKSAQVLQTSGTVDPNVKIETPSNFDGLKQPLKGLVCRDYDRIDPAGSDDNMMKITNGVIIQLYWKDIQPTENGAIVRGNRVDQAIDWARKFKAKYGIEIPIKVRLYCGVYSPDWLIKKGSFTILDEKLPKYWEPAFLTAFADVQQKLAAIYDNIPEISEVVDGATGLKSAENLIRPFGDNARKQQVGDIFLQAGYTKQNDSLAIIKSYQAMKPWKHTLISVCFSSYQYLDSKGNAYETAEGTIPFINSFVNMYGKQAVVGNNGLRTTAGSHGEDFAEGGERYKLYNYFKKLKEEKGVTIYFQTSTTKRSGSELSPVIEEGIKYGAAYIELPTGPKQFRELLGNQLEPLNKRVKAN